MLHQTWAYPQEKERLFEMRFKTTDEMFGAVEHAYNIAKEMIGADMIKSGEAMLKQMRQYPNTPKQ